MASKVGICFALCVIVAFCHDGHAEPLPKSTAKTPIATPPPVVTPEFGTGFVPPRLLQQPWLGPGLQGNRPPGSPPPLIVAIGDSITVGAGDDSAPDCLSVNRERAGAASRLTRLEHRPVINEGACGEDTFGGRQRIHSLLDRWWPETVLILYSPNDRLNEMSAVVENLRFMINAVKQRAIRPVIGTLTPTAGPFSNRESFILTLNEEIRRLAAQERIALADHHRAFTTDRSFKNKPEALLSRDGLHPNGRGYDLMAQTWSEALHQTGNASPAAR